MTPEAGKGLAPRAHLIAATVVFLAVVIACAGLRTVFVNDNAYSRLATVFGIVHQGTWFIDVAGNPYGPLTVDKVQVDGHMLSSKPPVMPLAMTAVYVPLHAIGLVDLGDSTQLKFILQLFTVLFGIIPFALGLVFFYLTLGFLVADTRVRLALLCAFTFGTQLLGFAPQLNNHVPGAALCIGAIYVGIGLLTGALAPTTWRFVLFGALGGLTHAVDLPLTIFIAALGLGLLARFPLQTMVWGGLGMLPPLAVHFGVLYLSSGMPLPVQMRKELYLFENSPWRFPVGIDGLNESKAAYAFHLLLGRHGTFLLFPILLFGWAAFVAAIWRREMAHRGLVIAAGTSVLLLFAYYIKSTNNYGGAAYGFRWAMGAMPVLLLMAGPLLAQARGRVVWAVFVVALAVSAWSSWECYQQPWSTDAEWTVRIFGPTI